MQFTLLSALAFVGVALASPALESRQSSPFCSEAGRFGRIELSKSDIAAGDAFHIKSDFSCSYQKGIRPEFIDYEIRVLVNNNGHQPPVVLERRTFDPTQGSIDEFDTVLPHFFYFPNSGYSVTAQLTYPVTGADGNPVYIVGQTYEPFNLIV